MATPDALVSAVPSFDIFALCCVSQYITVGVKEKSAEFKISERMEALEKE
jgi:hypothetical protein